MHVGIDIREACKAERTGKGQWCYGLVRELLARQCTLTLFTDREIPEDLRVEDVLDTQQHRHIEAALL